LEDESVRLRYSRGIWYPVRRTYVNHPQDAPRSSGVEFDVRSARHMPLVEAVARTVHPWSIGQNSVN